MQFKKTHQNVVADHGSRHDPEAYDFRAWIHDNLANHKEAKRDRQLTR